MGMLGLSLDLSSSGVVGWGDGISTAEVEYSPALTLGAMIKGSAFALGAEGGVSYVRTNDYARGPHIFGWHSGIRGDWMAHGLPIFLKAEEAWWVSQHSSVLILSNLMWAFRVCLGIAAPATV